MAYTGWQLAARKMVADACLDEYRKANSGKKKNVGYLVPEWCKPMINALENGDEETTKSMMHCVRVGALTQIDYDYPEPKEN